MSLPLEIELEIRKRELEEEAQLKYKDSLANFVKDAWHILEPASPYIHGWHIDVMCQHLQAVTDGKITRLLINVPPGMMKSLLVNIFWPSWEWGVKGLDHYRYLCASHSKDLSIRDNVKMRRLLISEWYKDRFPNIILTSDQDAKEKYENTRTGFRQAVAAGAITGERGDRVIIDDPQSVEDVTSDSKRARTKEWFQEAVPTRLNKPDKSAIVVIMQRLHQEDVSGLILESSMGYVHLCLPMEYEADNKCTTFIGFEDPRQEDGELLFPERFPATTVTQLKMALGEYSAAGQLQQRPSPRGGGIIKNKWIQIVKNLPEHFTFVCQSWDTAFKTKQENDFSVGTTWGVLDGNFYLIDRLKGKFEFPELLMEAKKFASKHNPHLILIEDKASGQSLIQSAQREINFKIKKIRPDADKITRTHATTHLWENGRVFVVDHRWTQDYIKNITMFPHAKHDDDVDSTTMALLFLEKITKSHIKRDPILDYMGIDN